MSRGFTPECGPPTVEIIVLHKKNEHRCQLPPAEIYPAGSLARCEMCGDVWIARHSRIDDGHYWGNWWRLGLFGLWRHRKALR